MHVVGFQSLPGHVERHARERPDAVAVTAPDGLMSYLELNKAANRLAAHLSAGRLRPGDFVGVLAPRGSRFITALLAVLKAGGVYVPLDPAYPTERLRAVIDRVSPAAVITVGTGAGAMLAESGVAVVDADDPRIASCSADDACRAIEPNQLCYVIFTSGSTGEPKGVMVTHGNVARLFDGAAGGLSERLDCDSRDVWSQFHSCAFGFSIFEIWGALVHGACLCIVPDLMRGDGRAIARFLKESRVTVLALTPSAFRETVLSAPFDEVWADPGVRAVVLSGEPVTQPDLRRWFEVTRVRRPRLINTYAVTETGGNLMFKEIRPADVDGGVSALGSALPDVGLHVLDADRNAVAPGAAGELYVSGTGVARGYLGDDQLTQLRFVTVPGIDGVAYRTGDRVRVDRQGEYQFLGRADEQVKWRGQRLELGEIESLLCSHPGISAAAAAIHAERGDERLVAYVVADATPEFWPSLGASQVYDPFLYDLMSTDDARNHALRTAFYGEAFGKTVLDIGTGPHALLARMAIDAGAAHVYAVEIDPVVAGQARAQVAAAGLANRITIIAGDGGNLELSRPIDICTQGIIGNIGSADGIGPVWNAARRHFSDVFVPVPKLCTTMIAPVELPELLRAAPAFTPLANDYVERMFAAAGRRFDVRLCVRNLPRGQLLGEPAVFEDLDFQGMLPEQWRGSANFEVTRPGHFDGFLLWTVVTMREGEIVDYLAHQHAWLPVFFPLPDGGTPVRAGERLATEWHWAPEDGERAPDYSLAVSWDGGRRRSRYVTRHREPALNATAIHRRLWTPTPPLAESLSPAQLRAWLARHLPDSLLPNAWMYLPALPVSANGKLDRKSLPAPTVDRVWGGHGGAPRGALESDLAALWSELLGVAAVGRHDNFFELGGDSISAVRLTTRLQQLLDADVMLAAIFESTTISALAHHLEHRHPDAIARRYGARRASASGPGRRHDWQERGDR